MILKILVLLISSIISAIIILRFLSRTSIFYILKKHFRSFKDFFYVFQFYKVPQYNENLQENQLYRKVSIYIQSLPTVEDSDFANLFTGNKSNEINVILDSNQTVTDAFLGARVTWTNQVETTGTGSKTFVLKIRRNDKRRILRPYLQHIHTISDEIEQRRKELKLYVNCESEPLKDGRWRSVPFTHPSTMDNMAMDLELKNKVKSDLELFLKSKQYYHQRLGRVWKRSYLLYGSSGTGKSSFIAAMAKVLSYDVYDVDLSKVTNDSDLKMLLMQTTNKSLIVVEDLDRFLIEKSTAVSLSGLLNFMDGIVSCCGEERVMVFTMNGKDHVDPAVLRPGRIDVHIHFPTCDFSAFKTLANSHLGLKDHKLFPQVEEMFQTGGATTMSPAEIGEIMISNRSSPSRALKTVITALQRGGSSKGQHLSKSGSDRVSSDESGEPDVICRESVHTVREFRKLYGLLRLRSGRKEEPLDLGSVEKQGSRHGS